MKLFVTVLICSLLVNCSSNNSFRFKEEEPTDFIFITINDTTIIYSSSTREFKNDSIPEDVFGMVNLKELRITGMDCDYKILDNNGSDITECWMIREIPAQIENLKNLEVLSLTLHAIQTLPPQISKLQNLKVIDLTDNIALSDITPLTELTQLEELYLFGCHLTKFPGNLNKLTHLKKLGLTGNNIDKAEIERIKRQSPNCQVSF